MIKYILRRILIAFVTLFVIATATFALINSIPGDPIAAKAKVLPEEVQKAIRAKYKLDQPLYKRYFYYLSDLSRGDLGQSIQYAGKRVNDMVAQEMPVSARLGLQAVFFGITIGVILGILAAFNRNTWVDYLVMTIAILGIVVPGFVMAILLQTWIGGKFGLPIVGWGRARFLTPFKYTLIPMISMSFGTIATNARFMRASVLDVIGQDYILTAKAKGVSSLALTWKHTIRNAAIPVITTIGPAIAGVLTGSLVIETIFTIPGMGREMVGAISNRDYTVIMSLTLIFASLYIVSLILVDIAYVLVDPRIKLSKGSR